MKGIRIEHVRRSVPRANPHNSDPKESIVGSISIQNNTHSAGPELSTQPHKYDRLDQKSIKRIIDKEERRWECKNTASSGITRYTASKGQEKFVSGTREGTGSEIEKGRRMER